MKTLLVLQPGQRGTRKLLAEHGKRLVRVRYRYDERLQRRWKTVELIVSEVVWRPAAPRPGIKVSVRTRIDETALHGGSGKPADKGTGKHRFSGCGTKKRLSWVDGADRRKEKHLAPDASKKHIGIDASIQGQTPSQSHNILDGKIKFSRIPYEEK